MKQTFNIPDGCKTVSVEQVGNQIITSFEPEKYVPKAGDLVKNISEKDSRIFAIYVLKQFYKNGRHVNFGDYITNIGLEKDNGIGSFAREFSIFEKLTPEEFQAEFEKLGYVYDFETHTAQKKRWRAKLKREYYCVNAAFDIEFNREDGHSIDAKRHKNGNYFETKEECQKYRDYMMECSLKYFDK